MDGCSWNGETGGQMRVGGDKVRMRRERETQREQRAESGKKKSSCWRREGAGGVEKAVTLSSTCTSLKRCRAPAVAAMHLTGS